MTRTETMARAQGMLDVQNHIINLLGQATEAGQLSALLSLNSDISQMRAILASKITDEAEGKMTDEHTQL